MKILCTFAGKTGDILWSLPTVRELANLHGDNGKADMAIMPQYAGLLPLLRYQPYIEDAFVIPEWRCTGSPFGDQPWEAPVHAIPGYERYERVWHLTYRVHPNESLPVALARQQNLSLPAPFLPFIQVPKDFEDGLVDVVLAFNELYEKEKWDFTQRLLLALPRSTKAFGVSHPSIPWLQAAQYIQSAKFFLGCRSAHYVLAHGLGKRCLVFEPHQTRRWPMFGPPEGQEVMPEVGDFETFVRVALEWLGGNDGQSEACVVHSGDMGVGGVAGGLDSGMKGEDR